MVRTLCELAAASLDRPNLGKFGGGAGGDGLQQRSGATEHGAAREGGKWGHKGVPVLQ